MASAVNNNNAIELTLERALKMYRQHNRPVSMLETQKTRPLPLARKMNHFRTQPSYYDDILLFIYY